METTLIEAPGDSEKSNVEAPVETKVEATAEAQKVEEKASADAQETQVEKAEAVEEPTFEVDGEKLTASQIKKLKEDYTNDSKWKARNQAEAEANKKARLEVAQLEYLKSVLEQRPEILQQLIAPPVKRDFDRELQEHYANVPSEYDQAALIQWNLKRDSLIREQAASMANEVYQKQSQERDSREYHSRLERAWKEKYVDSGKLTPEEFSSDLQWVVANVNPHNGKIPEQAFDHAFKILHEDKYLSGVKLEATQKAVGPILKAKASVTNNGNKQRETAPTVEDDLDNDFVQRVKRTVPKYERVT